MIILRSKSFTKYDDTDNLKRMKDSDILAEQEKELERLNEEKSREEARSMIMAP